MKALLQRVTRASVSVDGTQVGEIAKGLVILLGIRKGDSVEDATWLARKTFSIRVFEDACGRMNLSLDQTGGEALVISQFTLYADTRRGHRPGFQRAEDPSVAKTLYDVYVDTLSDLLGQQRVATGQFGAHMHVQLLNDGPVTVELTSDSE